MLLFIIIIFVHICTVHKECLKTYTCIAIYVMTGIFLVLIIVIFAGLLANCRVNSKPTTRHEFVGVHHGNTMPFRKSTIYQPNIDPDDVALETDAYIETEQDNITDWKCKDGKLANQWRGETYIEMSTLKAFAEQLHHNSARCMRHMVSI